VNPGLPENIDQFFIVSPDTGISLVQKHLSPISPEVLFELLNKDLQVPYTLLFLLKVLIELPVLIHQITSREVIGVLLSQGVLDVLGHELRYACSIFFR
jgi:hypothetical protein